LDLSKHLVNAHQYFILVGPTWLLSYQLL